MKCSLKAKKQASKRADCQTELFLLELQPGLKCAKFKLDEQPAFFPGTSTMASGRHNQLAQTRSELAFQMNLNSAS